LQFLFTLSAFSSRWLTDESLSLAAPECTQLARPLRQLIREIETLEKRDSKPYEVPDPSLREMFIRGNFAIRTFVAEDGYPGSVIHSNREAADRAMSELKQFLNKDSVADIICQCPRDYWDSRETDHYCEDQAEALIEYLLGGADVEPS